MKKVNFLITYLIIWFYIVVASSTVHASDQPFGKKLETQGTHFALQGIGHKKVFFIRAFTAGFYLGDKNNAGNVLKADVPKHLEVEYFVSIPAKKLVRFTTERMKLNLSESEMQSIDDKVELMNEYFVDLNPGDRFALTYIPEEGTVFTYNGVDRGVIAGEDFAKAIFSVWVGDKPFDQRLKRQMLGLNSSTTDSDAG